MQQSSAYLRLLGGVQLERDGIPLTGRGAQRRRLAVLSLLAATGPKGMSRERIAAILWPDMPENRGRRQVTEALFQSQPEWGASGNVEGVVASALGPKDMAVVRKHLDDPALDDEVDKDALLGLRREVVSTPTMFITGGGNFEKVEGALTYGAMQRRLDALLP